jgi:hypothetical protein
VDRTGSGGHLDSDVEGLTIYYAANGAGYLIASSQGNDEFAVYRREGNNAYVGRFKLVAGGGIDAVTDTDGIDVTNFPLGNQFPQGMFIAQDNDDNFKLARWEAIDAAFGGGLTIDTSWNPRLVGRKPQPNPLPGDYDGSGIVDTLDYIVWRNAIGTTGLPPNSDADGNGDGRVDADDYDVWRANFGRRLPAAANSEEAHDANPSNATASATHGVVAAVPGALELSRKGLGVRTASTGLQSDDDDALVAWVAFSTGRASYRIELEPDDRIMGGPDESSHVVPETVGDVLERLGDDLTMQRES